MILSGTNTYSDGTTIVGGTLQLGNGGTTGSLVGDVVDNGTLAFNRSDTVTFGNTISGSGGVTQAGSGITILTKDNTYTGPTNVTAGILYINGNQGGATGTTTVSGTGQLGGTGTIGGNTTLTGTSTLRPGSVPLTPGTLTIDGDLALGANSRLFYNVVEAGVAGGALNDLIVVNGKLTLDGTINILDQGQTLGPGIYRIINYTGGLANLTNNGLTIGAFTDQNQNPTGRTLPDDLFVQTAIPDQVNLVNATGMNLNYWDGNDDVANKNNYQINGGSGIWHNEQDPGDDNNWTRNPDGYPNAPWQDGAFAIFTATAGTVTVNNAIAGQVEAIGMQFASDGYLVTGDPLTLLPDATAGGVSIIRVGDGTPAGENMTATISSVLQGNTVLQKTDLGTLILTAANTYTGGTNVLGGVLQIATDASLGSGGALTLSGGGTIRTTAPINNATRTTTLGSGGGIIEPINGSTLTLHGVVNGAGSLTKEGDGTLVLVADNTYSGGTTISAGTLQVGNGATTGSILGDITDNAALVFDRSTDYTYSGTITGTGSVTQAGTNTLTLTGNSDYDGGTIIETGGTLQLGAGGITGSITGNVTDNGTLVFNRSDTVTFTDTISGSGGVTQAGSGITILTADNAYDGPTTISNGWLYVNGDQSGATGLTTADSGTRLGGDGIVGSDVTIADNATLGPGSQPRTPATLTINGDLALNQDSILFYNMIEANVAGGALNDLVEVDGDLVLDGVINIVDEGQTLGPGVYRIFNYSGDLLSNSGDTDGLRIGNYVTAPTSPQDTPVVGAPLTGFFVQTSIPNQVNLVNTAGLTLTYWDGDLPTSSPNPSDRDNGQIGGGDGVWHNLGSDDDWTGSDGTINAPWTDAAFAIFTAASGTVTVDNSQGNVTATGMQFASNGYVVTGDAITLVPDYNRGGVSYIRVGDGTPAGATITATIEAELTGQGGGAALIKQDLGTLILSGDNSSYTGGIFVTGGTLQVSADNNLGGASAPVFISNDSTLRTTSSFASGRLIFIGNADGGASGGNSNGVIETQGSGTVFTVNSAIVTPSGQVASLIKTGEGRLILTADTIDTLNYSSYIGGTTVKEGILQLGDPTVNSSTTGSILGDVEVLSDGTLVFNRSNEYVFAGMVSGEGDLQQIGSGTTILTNANTYTGGTTISDGSLQLGNGGTTGSITGDVATTGDGNLAFNRSDTYTFAGVVSGTGSLSQIGSGTTVLTNANTYEGGTTITQGTLQIGDGGDTGSIAGNVSTTADGTLAFNRDDTVDLIFTSIISGDGQVNQIGTGTTILTGDSDYTGRTTISSGVLQLGNGGGTGSIISDVVNNATLAVDHNDTVILPGQITGTGAFIQQGSGTTIFTANNTYGGGTTIEAGILQLGNGGTGGNVFGDIINKSTLAFDRTDLLPIIGSISGTGSVEQNGTGETVLFGVNSYTGPTNVNAGTLYIDGEQPLATGLTTVKTDAKLGGTGIIGGNVVVQSGATLSPGDVGDLPSTLTINQDLTLESGALLDYSFGEANVPGGPLNDLTVVKGNLTLNGTINVKLSEGGSFDVGIYRVFSYDGGLANNILEIGTIPVGSTTDYFIQTSVAQQVNLAYTAGLTLNFWDAIETKGNGLVNGGNGTWQAAGTLNNWTNQLGLPNAPWANAAFAIFMATADTVNVDIGNGEVRAAGMQFASNGYVIQGDPVTLVTSDATPGASIIRVGDGSSLGSGYTAIIRSVLRGDITLTKTDIGTLVLTGDNTYTGGTAITGGVLEISRDANLGLAGTGLSMNNGTLRTTATMVSARDTLFGEVGGIFETLAGTSFTNSGVISGDGPLTKTGDGTLILTGENTYTKLTTISQGTLQLGDGGSSGNLASRVWNNSILAFNRSDEFVFGSAIFGTGAVEQIGSGTTVLTATNTYEGPTAVAAGTLQAGATNTFSPNSSVTVASGATLDLAGFDQTIPELTNAGTVLLNGAPGTVLTVRGDYTGFGGTMVFNTYLGSDTSPSDRLVIDGGVGDDTGVLVNNIGGPGARTTGDGILLVEAINGATTTTTAFALAGPVVAGPYEYSLYRGGSSGGSPDNWFLRSVLDCSLAPTLPECQNPPGPTPPPHYRPETSLYTAIPSLALAYDNVLLDTLDQRMGGLRSFQGTGSNRETNDPAHLAWGRIVRLNGSRDGDTHGIYDDAGPDYDYTFNAVQVGTDLVRNEHADGSFDSTGLYLAYGHSEADVDHFDRTPAGTDKLDGWTIGGYWTHFGASGWYVDTVVQGTWYDIKTEGRLPEMTTDGFGLGASLEAGYPFHCANTVVVEPQAQVTYQTIDLDDTRDVGSVVRFSDVDSLVGRLGVRLSRSWKPAPAAPSADKQRKAATVWVRASLVNEFLGRPETRFSSADGYIPFQTDTQGAGYVIDTGIDAEIADNISLYGNLLFQNRFDGDDHAFGGQLGLKIKF